MLGLIWSMRLGMASVGLSEVQEGVRVIVTGHGFFRARSNFRKKVKIASVQLITGMELLEEQHQSLPDIWSPISDLRLLLADYRPAQLEELRSLRGTLGFPGTVAPFRAWRGSRDLVAQSPKFHVSAVVHCLTATKSLTYRSEALQFRSLPRNPPPYSTEHTFLSAQPFLPRLS